MTLPRDKVNIKLFRWYGFRLDGHTAARYEQQKTFRILYSARR